MKRQKIVTFGELLLRFSKPNQLRLTQGDMFTSKYGGSEANVAVSLATLGEDVTYITRLPDTPVGHAGAQCLAQLGVDISHVIYGGQRIGTYYFEPAAGMRAAKVVYDRANSAYYDLKPGMIPWREILKDVRRWDSPFRSTSTIAKTCGSMGLTLVRRCNGCCHAAT